MDKAIHTDKHGTETTKAKVDQLLLREKIKQLREKGYEQEVRAFVLDAKEKQLEYEYRYNHYHDPHNGRFASAGAAGSGSNYGQGLYYSMGKGKGEIVGASSAWSAPKQPTITYEEYNSKLNSINKKVKKLYDERKKVTKSLTGDEYLNVWDEYTKKIDEAGKEAEALKKSVPKEYHGIATTIDTFGGTGKQAALLMPDGTYKTAGDTTTYLKAQKRLTKQVESWLGHG